MHRFTLFSTLVLVATGFATASAADRPPNILLILADDLGWGDVSHNGRKTWNTPHIDKLGSQGTIFKRWYTAAVVCAPSRAALMTGKYTIHNGVTANNDDLPRDEVTLAEALKKQGYSTALFGKWHHGQPRPMQMTYTHPIDHGFDEFFGYTNARHAWEHFPKQLWFGREQKPVQGFSATLLTDRSLEFMKQNQEKPFFLYLAYIEPHLLIEAPPEDIAEHAPKFKEKDPAKPWNAAYAAMITRMDKEIGRVMAGLEELKLAQNTLVIFSSDHGATFEVGNLGTANYHDSNHPLRGQKRTLWEGGVRVPGIARWPGRVPAGKVSHTPVHMTDVFPTVLAAAGGTPDAVWKVDGRNLLPHWEGKEPAPERTLYWEWRSEGILQLAAMRGDHKLVQTGTNRPELFDVEKDPSERRNVIAEHPELARDMEQGLKAWLATETEAARWGKQRPKP